MLAAAATAVALVWANSPWQVLARLELTDASLTDAATIELLPTSLDSYGFELFRGATCAWYTEWINAVETNDTEAPAFIANAVESTIAANTGTAFERSSQMLTVPLLDTISGRQPDTANDYGEGCPNWALSG